MSNVCVSVCMKMCVCYNYIKSMNFFKQHIRYDAVVKFSVNPESVVKDKFRIVLDKCKYCSARTNLISIMKYIVNDSKHTWANHILQHGFSGFCFTISRISDKCVSQPI